MGFGRTVSVGPRVPGRECPAVNGRSGGARTPTALRAEEQDRPICLFRPCASPTRALHPRVCLFRPPGGRRLRPPDLPFTAGHSRPGTRGPTLTARPKPMRNVSYLIQAQERSRRQGTSLAEGTLSCIRPGQLWVTIRSSTLHTSHKDGSTKTQNKRRRDAQPSAATAYIKRALPKRMKPRYQGSDHKGTPKTMLRAGSIQMMPAKFPPPTETHRQYRSHCRRVLTCTWRFTPHPVS